jgi:hypothetical protein
MDTRKLAELLFRLCRFLRRKPDTQDPDCKVRVPVKKGPGGLTAAVALKEPRG